MVNVELVKKHEQMLYPTVRVRCLGVGGSGTVVYSGKNKKGEYETYVVTNHHVIESGIVVKKVWDSKLGKDIKKDIRSTATVEFFKYNNYSRCIGNFGVESDIVAYDSEQDMALLRLRDKENSAKHVAKIYPKNKIRNIHVFDRVYAVGAALGHAPLQTPGEITHMDDEIENYKYWMSNAQTIYGNSGGAIYRFGDNYEYIGIPSRISVSLSGFSATPITHMGFFIPIDRIYDFLQKNCYDFIYDSTRTIEQCEKTRKREKDRERKLLESRAGIVEDEDSEEYEEEEKDGITED